MGVWYQIWVFGIKDGLSWRLNFTGFIGINCFVIVRIHVGIEIDHSCVAVLLWLVLLHTTALMHLDGVAASCLTTGQHTSARLCTNTNHDRQQHIVVNSAITGSATLGNIPLELPMRKKLATVTAHRELTVSLR